MRNLVTWLLLSNILGHRRRRWGAGGAPAPLVGVKCRNFGQNFGQFHIFWAILRQNFGQFHIIWAILCQNFGQVFVVRASLPTKILRALDRKTVSTWVKIFFFLRSPLFWQKKTIDLSLTLTLLFCRNYNTVSKLQHSFNYNTISTTTQFQLYIDIMKKQKQTISKKAAWSCQATFKSFFGQNFGAPPPQIILSPYAHVWGESKLI